MVMKTSGMTGIEAAGTLKDPMYTFIILPCAIEKVCNCAKHVFIKIVLRMMGIILVRIFTSSTWVTEQTLHDSGLNPSGRIAALSNNLFKDMDFLKLSSYIGLKGIDTCSHCPYVHRQDEF